MTRQDEAILAALHAAFADGTLLQYHGGHVRELEALLSDQFRSPFALTCSSGTLAVEAGLRALKVVAGDEVILAAYEYEANFLNVHALGAKPVLVDVSPFNWNLDPDRLEEAISPATKVVLVSHLHGGLVPMSRVTGIARKYRLKVLEDAAQAAGAVVEGRPAGSWGDVGVLSFGGSKLLSSGRGGAILTPHPEVHQRAKLWLSRGVQQWAALSEMQAVVLKPQLANLAEMTRRRDGAVRLLASRIADVSGLTLFENRLPESVPAFYKVGFRFDAARFGASRESFLAATRAGGAAFDEGFRALHVGRSPSRFRAVGSLTEAERAHRGTVKLHHPVLLGGEGDLEQVANAVREAYRKP